jgi:ribonuclease BN (tRNA processing enzyme)
MIDMVTKTKDKLGRDLNVMPFLDKAVGPNILKTLHKWNSCSPLFSTGVSQGGGYLLTVKNHLGAVRSIAIDPGYEFLEIFKYLDLSIVDLDAIIATHDHDDHTESIEAILSLLAKHNDHVPQSRVKTLDIFGSPGVMLKYQGLFNALDPWGNKEINFKLLVPGTTIDHIGPVSLKDKYGCSFHVKQAFHQELWTHEESAVGLVVETNIIDKNGHIVCVGVTGDTRYEKGIGEQYRGCQVLLFNIGSLEKEEGKLLGQHLGLIGSINVIKEAKPRIAVLTEFGEEFRGKRATVASVIEEWASPMEGVTVDNEFKVIPADMHFELRLTDLYVKETSSRVFLPYKMIETDESESEIIMYKMREK